MQIQKNLLLIFIISLCSVVNAEEDIKEYFYVKPSAFTGEIFLSMTEDDKALYLLGLGDGINLAPFFKVDEDSFAKYRECFKEMTGADLAKTVTEYLETNVELKKEGIHITSFKAYTQLCYAKHENESAN